MNINEEQPMGKTKPVYSELAIGRQSDAIEFGRDPESVKGAAKLSCR